MNPVLRQAFKSLPQLSLSSRQAGRSMLLLVILFALAFLLAGIRPQSSLAQGACPDVAVTTVYASVAGYITPGTSAPVGAQVLVLNPRGDVIGCTVVTTAGQYPALRFYGDDPVNTPGAPGLRDGERPQFKVNGIIVTPFPRDDWGLPLWDLIWNATRDKHAVYQVDLAPSPAVDAGTDQTAWEGNAMFLDPASFTDPNDDDNHVATINWGDGLEEPGTVDQAANTVSGSHTYAMAGSYIVTVCVSNKNGGMGCDTFTATVAEVWRFRGYTFIDGTEPPAPLADVGLSLFGRAANQAAPGTLIKAIHSDPGGFFNFFVIRPWVYDIFRLEIESPAGYVVTRIESEDGVIQADGAIEWVHPASAVHMNEIYFSIPTPTPTATPIQTPTATPTPTPTVTFNIWLPFYLLAN